MLRSIGLLLCSGTTFPGNVRNARKGGASACLIQRHVFGALLVPGTFAPAPPGAHERGHPLPAVWDLENVRPTVLTRKKWTITEVFMFMVVR